MEIEELLSFSIQESDILVTQRAGNILFQLEPRGSILVENQWCPYYRLVICSYILVKWSTNEIMALLITQFKVQWDFLVGFEQINLGDSLKQRKID